MKANGEDFSHRFRPNIQILGWFRKQVENVEQIIWVVHATLSGKGE